MQGDIVSQGVELMLFGMGTVVVFLALLVVSTTAMSRFIARYFPESEAPALAALERLHGQQSEPSDDPKLVAAISAAIHQYRAKKR
jgi:oxaloacetate decarboxylase gamma subunit